jgi:hypothetical protein
MKNSFIFGCPTESQKENRGTLTNRHHVSQESIQLAFKPTIKYLPCQSESAIPSPKRSRSLPGATKSQ